MTKISGKLMLIAAVCLMFTAVSCLKNEDTDKYIYTSERESALITQYITTLTGRGYDIDTSANGVFYVILEEGEGNYVQADDSIGITYSGFFPDDGTVFDESARWYDDGIWKYKHKSYNLTAGFDEAIGLLNKGAKGLFLIPSDLAYGSLGNPPIPPYSPIVFEITLVDIYE